MLAVVDGADYSAGSCGFIDMGTSRINVPRSAFPTGIARPRFTVICKAVVPGYR